MKSILSVDCEINQLDTRSAMNKPQYYVPCFGEFFDYSKFWTLQQNELIRVIEDPRSPITCRISAGKILAIKGDSRINVFFPSMINIPASQQVSIGLPLDQVEAVTEQLSDLGVRSAWISKECPRFTVAIESFNIGRYPVTNLEYRQFLVETHYPHIPSSWQFGRFNLECSNHPVWSVPVEAAEAYTKWLSDRTGRLFRLPSEIEWEYAATGGNPRVYPWGDEFNADLTNTLEGGILSSTPVGAFPNGASPFGVLDMAGNVEEYTSNCYWIYPGGSDVKDDLGSIQTAYRIARGGCFSRFRDLARTTRRHGYYQKDIFVYGFRLAESL